jgi:hypothetical protein
MDDDLLQTLRATVAGSAFHSWAGIQVVEADPGSVTVVNHSVILALAP